MKVFRELYLYLPVSSADKFFEEVENNLCDGWTRDHESEKRLMREAQQRYYFFSCDKETTREAATIAFTTRDNEIVLVANIVPRQPGKLSIGQYNDILMDFYGKILQAACRRNSIDVDITDDNQSMENWVSQDSYNKLKRFSIAANKSTGSSHPCDQERWFEFIVSIVINDEKLGTDQLERWLVEEEGWQRDIASDLAIEYEQGIALLQYYKNS